MSAGGVHQPLTGGAGGVPRGIGPRMALDPLAGTEGNHRVDTMGTWRMSESVTTGTMPTALPALP